MSIMFGYSLNQRTRIVSDSHLMAEKQDQKKPLIVISLASSLMTAFWFTKEAMQEQTTTHEWINIWQDGQMRNSPSRFQRTLLRPRANNSSHITAHSKATSGQYMQNMQKCGQHLVSQTLVSQKELGNEDEEWENLCEKFSKYFVVFFHLGSTSSPALS